MDFAGKEYIKDTAVDFQETINTPARLWRG
jgi:hypothetical protein